MTREVRYIEVPAEEVPVRTRRAAESAVRFAAVDLAMGAPPSIRWFADCPPTPGEAFAWMGGSMQTPPPPEGSFELDRPILGMNNADEWVWLRANVGTRRAAEIGLHETLHAWQRRVMGPAHGPHEFDGREAQARAYETDLRGIAQSIATTVSTSTMEGDHHA